MDFKKIASYWVSNYAIITNRIAAYRAKIIALFAAVLAALLTH